jgi:hypothetical protein
MAVEKEPSLWNITGECSMIVLPQKEALVLLPDLLDDRKIEAGFSRLKEMVAQGTAELVSTLILKLQNGEKGIAESIEEMRYPTEFEPPRLPESAPRDPKILKEWPAVGITPTAFETRNVGTVLELEARTPDGEWIAVKCVPYHVRFLRWAKTDAGKLANGERLTVEAPIFHSMRDTASLLVRSGQMVFIGVHKLPEPLQGMEFCFLRVSAAPGGSK